MKKIYLITLLCILLTILNPQSFASSMTNSTYQLDLQANPNTGTDTPNPPSKANSSAQTITTKADVGKHIVGDGFIADLSYDEDTRNLPLVFSISNNQLNFGDMKPGEAVIRSQSVSVLPGSAQGYQVLSSQDHNLSDNNAQIPATSCDSGSCTSVLSDSWAIPLTYGFGYRCDNVQANTCNEAFSNNSYRRFANIAAGEPPTSMITSLTGENSQSAISYKINIAGNQPQIGYQTTIYLIASPNF